MAQETHPRLYWSELVAHLDNLETTIEMKIALLCMAVQRDMNMCHGAHKPVLPHEQASLLLRIAACTTEHHDVQICAARLLAMEVLPHCSVNWPKEVLVEILKFYSVEGRCFAVFDGPEQQSVRNALTNLQRTATPDVLSLQQLARALVVTGCWNTIVDQRVWFAFELLYAKIWGNDHILRKDAPVLAWNGWMQGGLPRTPAEWYEFVRDRDHGSARKAALEFDIELALNLAGTAVMNHFNTAEISSAAMTLLQLAGMLRGIIRNTDPMRASSCR